MPPIPRIVRAKEVRCDTKKYLGVILQSYNGTPPKCTSLIRAPIEHYPLARREAPAEDRRPEGEGANFDRHLGPYHA